MAFEYIELIFLCKEKKLRFIFLNAHLTKLKFELIIICDVR